jgi:hypothetical protein
MRSWLAPLSTAAALFVLTPPAHAKDVVLLSTQLRPLEEAQRARTEILKDSPVPVNFVSEQPPQLVIHIGRHEIRLTDNQPDRCTARGARPARLP